ncbi:hypothetical protein C8039_12675 [Halogeometricum sp. wsp3]|nr:hypothetical protein C8039_12675 [Halogeometricum sp. wsp3]
MLVGRFVLPVAHSGVRRRVGRVGEVVDGGCVFGILAVFDEVAEGFLGSCFLNHLAALVGFGVSSDELDCCLVARVVMEETPHIFVAGDPAVDVAADSRYQRVTWQPSSQTPSTRSGRRLRDTRTRGLPTHCRR